MRWQKEEIERFVSPLAAREAVKDRLREELWGHLASIFEEEVLRVGNTEDAKRAACQRLGSVDTMEKEFTRSLALHERIEGGFMRRIAPVGVADIRSYAFRYALRLFASSTIGLFLFALVTIKQPGMTTISSFIAFITGAMALALAATSAGIVIHEYHVRANTRQEETEPVRRLRPPWVSVPACVSVSFAVSLLAWLMGYAASVFVCVYFDQMEMLSVVEVFGHEVLLPASAILSLLSPGLAWALEWQEHRARKLPEWPYFRERSV